MSNKESLKARLEALKAAGKAVASSLNSLSSNLATPLKPRGFEKGVKPPAEFQTEWARRPLASAVRTVFFELGISPLSKALARPEVRGLDLLESAPSPFIICPNHASHLDTPVILSALPRTIRQRTVVGAAADYFFKTRLRAVASALLLNAIPIERMRAMRLSADLAAQLLLDGFNLLLFPEGGRSEDGFAREFKPGAAYLAARTGAYIVPAYLKGTADVLGKGQNLPRPGKVKLYFGKPIAPERDPRNLTKKLEEAVARLALEEKEGMYKAMLSGKEKAELALKGIPDNTWLRYWKEGKEKKRSSWPL